MLTGLGLTPAEQDLYQHLVRLPPTSLAELTVSHGEAVLSVVDRLVVLGLLVRVAGTPERVAVVSPRAVLEPLYLAHASQLAEIRGRLLAQATRAGVEAAARRTHPPVELLRDRQATLRAHQEVKLSVRHAFRFWDAPPYLTDPTVTTTTDDEILERGVTVRVVYDPQAVNIPGRPATLIREAAHNVHARVADLPMKLSIADQTLAMAVQVGDGRVEGLLIREPTLVVALVALFELHWERGVPLGAYAAERLRVDEATDGPPGPDIADRELLLLLGAGLTDREIGEHLGQHERTIRKRIQRIKTRLGAETRYQAGYLAARYGWISSARQPGDDGGNGAAA